MWFWQWSGSIIFTVRLHVMQRTVFPRPFCPSVCQTSAFIMTKRKNLCLHSYTIWKIIYSSFLTRRMAIWNFGSNWPSWSENADFQSTFSRSALAKKSSIISNRKSANVLSNEPKINQSINQSIYILWQILNVLTDGAVRQFSGREFQRLGAATEKRRAAVSKLCGGTDRSFYVDDFKTKQLTNSIDREFVTSAKKIREF